MNGVLPFLVFAHKHEAEAARLAGVFPQNANSAHLAELSEKRLQIVGSSHWVEVANIDAGHCAPSVCGGCDPSVSGSVSDCVPSAAVSVHDGRRPLSDSCWRLLS